MTGQFANANTNSDLAYQVAFGNFPNGSTYMDALNKIDRREEIKAGLQVESNLMATGTSYSATSGSIPVLAPSVLDPDILDVTKRDTPLASGLLPRVANRGLWADYVKQTALPSAKFKPEGAALDAQAPTLTRTATAMKYLYAVGMVSGPLMAGSQVWKDALKVATEAAFRSLKEMEEDCIINGNPTTGDVSGGTTDATAFTGLIQGITTNTTDNGTVPISIQNIRDGIRTCREAKGHPNLIVTDYKTLDDIKSLIQSELRYPTPGETIAWGIQAITFEGIPIIPDLFMPTDANEKELLILDTSVCQIRVLQDATFEELAKTADQYKFMIKEYLTLIIQQEDWCYRYYDLP